MIKSIPARKIGMTSAFDGAGTTVPITICRPLECIITEIKRPEKHGYAAVQVAYHKSNKKHINKPHQGVLDKAGAKKPFRYFYEIRVDPAELDDYEIGKPLYPMEFVPNWDQITITGTSKGKGFAGAMKRWGFAGQMRTHGDPDNRRPMSNNATDPARVFKGSKRPGRLGNNRVTIKGSTIFDCDQDLRLLAVSGSVPGPNGSIIFLNMVTERAPVEGE